MKYNEKIQKIYARVLQAIKKVTKRTLLATTCRIENLIERIMM